MAISDEEFQAANARANALLNAFPTIESVLFDAPSSRLHLFLSSGLLLGLPLTSIEGFANASSEALAQFEISPSGLTVFFPALNSEIYVPGVLQGFFGSKNWMAAQMGRAGGAVSSQSKAAAAKANGKLGGRPRKKSDTLKLAET
ncbi:MAG: DUF2442 domain-containing protein [Burkholderiales bacterium]|nr:DUF2442 domain-containing protein [Burkholderiales bacterium]